MSATFHRGLRRDMDEALFADLTCIGGFVRSWLESDSMPEGWFKVPLDISELADFCDHSDAVLVYVMLLWHTRSKRVCWPKLSTLERLTGLSNKQVRRMLDLLVERGLIEVEDLRPKSSKYTIAGEIKAVIQTYKKVTRATSSGQVDQLNRSHGPVLPSNKMNVNQKNETHALNEMSDEQKLELKFADNLEGVRMARRVAKGEKP